MRLKKLVNDIVTAITIRAKVLWLENYLLSHESSRPYKAYQNYTNSDAFRELEFFQMTAPFFVGSVASS